MAWIFLSSLLPGMLGRNFNHSENRKIFITKQYSSFDLLIHLFPLFTKRANLNQWSLARNSQEDSGISPTAGGVRLGILGAQVLRVQVQVQRGSSFYLYCMQSAHQWIKILDDKRPNWYKGQSINLSMVYRENQLLNDLDDAGHKLPHRHDDV